jgi:hypothetical protein
MFVIAEVERAMTCMTLAASGSPDGILGSELDDVHAIKGERQPGQRM